MRWAKRALAGVTALLVVAVLAVAVTGLVMVRSSFPDTDAESELAVLDAPVEVVRDDVGVPTIVAGSSDDLFRAQGYVHAQDRFWEMDFRRHVTAGRVAELFGTDQVETDTFVRTLGWRRVAEAELDMLEDDTLAMLEAYAEGVNAWMDGRSGRQLSLEHAMLPLTGAGGYEPEPWAPADSVAWLKAMAWDLRSNLEDELQRGRLALDDLPDDRDWRELFPGFDDDRFPPILPEGGELLDGIFRPAGTDADPTPIVEVPPTPPTTSVSDHGDGGPGADAATAAGHGTEPDREGLGDAEATEPDGRQGLATSHRQLLASDHVPDVDTDVDEAAAVDTALAAAQRALGSAPEVLGDGSFDGLGSNSWVVGPERSTTGTALLANDPHLAPSQPSLWYQVGLRCEPVGEDCPYHTLGYSFSGLPGIVIGHNADIGWGFTNLGADVADLFVERLDGDRYLTEDGWEPLEQHTEMIRVAGEDDVEVTVRRTRHGPLFSEVSDAGAQIADGAVEFDTHEAPADDLGDRHAVALRWVALDPRPTADAIPRLMRADGWESFREAASRFEVPSQNLVYADTEGHIGYQAPGRIPVRRDGDGTVPVPGWTGEYGWERFLAFEELPWQFDPDVGYIATANQPVLPEGQEPFLTADANRGYRAERIVEQLEDRSELSPADLRELQLDEYNGNAANLVPVLLGVEADGDDGVATLQGVLADWDLKDTPDAAGGAAFNATWRHLLARTFHTDLPDFAHPDGSARWWEVVRALVDDPGSVWWDDPETDTRETRDEVLHDAMRDAHAELDERFGDPDSWAWGELHTLTLTHGTFGTSGIGPVERLFNRGPLEVGGGSDIVNANGWNAAEGYDVVWVPSMRMVLDLGDLDAGEWVHLTGQSGRPFHGHYTDQAELWRDGGTVGMAFTAEAVDEAGASRAVLRPTG